MNLLRHFTLISAASLAVLTAVESRAVVVIGNLSSDHTTQFSITAGNPSLSSEAIIFTMGGTSATVSSVTLRLNNFEVGDVLNVNLYAHTGSDANYGSPVGSLIAPAPQGLGTFNYDFNASGVSLAANSKYWLIVRASAGVINWRVDFTSPTTSYSSEVGASRHLVLGSNNDGASFGAFDDTPDFAPHFQITAVPEPEWYGALFALGLVGFGFWRRRNSSRAKEQLASVS